MSEVVLPSNVCNDDSANSVGIYDPIEAAKSRRVLVIGSGPAGVRFAHELLKREPNAQVTLFGNEPYAPYNRVLLSALLAGDATYHDIQTALPDEETYKKFRILTATITHVAPSEKRITDNLGQGYEYDQLVIATGSRPHVPNIPGVKQQGVYTFRNLKDTESLSARISRARHVVVVGGGLLGLEAARGMLKFNTKVTLIQQASRLMNRQLDEPSAKLLRDKVEALGIEVVTESGVRVIEGRDNRVTGVVMRNGDTLECDTVLLCTGISPNVDLGLQANIRVARAIVVDDQLQTSRKDIYAIGECCEHNGFTYGLVSPGFEQAAIAADVITGGQARYQGSLEVSRLKVVGEQVCSMGEVADLPSRPYQSVVTYHNKSNGIYRKLVIYKGRLIGAVGLGEWPEARRIQEAFKQQRSFSFMQLMWFRLGGKLWSESDTDNVQAWPQSAIVCQCNNISQGELVAAVEQGATSVESLQLTTNAGTVCGSCKPLLAQLTGSHAEPQKEKGWLPMALMSVLAVMFASLMLFIPGLSVSDSVQQQPWFEDIWNDKFWKQVTGFTLLGLSVIGLLMSLRKRMGWTQMGQFSYWRLLHGVLGATCAGMLLVHTGFHLGDNLNRWLMVDFLAVLGCGALAGIVVANSHKFSPAKAISMRKFWSWIHTLVAWPLPILLSIHILTVYYF
ncbi:FAD-dependent oxidoreductase [Echinimonas agarilytica]|uniref:FAD-dependent oxidoreductase n=1 Tax=Echinimonas agarilytica TaxID=1215918 RepID=A0AA41W6W8_9GAMM|nr:FAD-dependent oxidoreductase [Echinimonas agarilytica]MCM2680090.1 FAD-dependent oxidoreductase [Echinimonas agarilytica]